MIGSYFYAKIFRQRKISSDSFFKFSICIIRFSRYRSCRVNSSKFFYFFSRTKGIMRFFCLLFGFCAFAAAKHVFPQTKKGQLALLEQSRLLIELADTILKASDWSKDGKGAIWRVFNFSYLFFYMY